MNTTLSAPPGRQKPPPQHAAVTYVPPSRSRVALLDRVALHLGVALIKWSRRSIETREQQSSRFEEQHARGAREREYERNLRLAVPPR